MGTNYYLFKNNNKPHCESCSCFDHERLHIGKSSFGWAFSLHVIPEENLNTLDDWLQLINNPNNSILDEYGRGVTPAELLKVIRREGYGKESLRHSEFCVGQGETWDYLTGEFS